MGTKEAKKGGKGIKVLLAVLVLAVLATGGALLYNGHAMSPVDAGDTTPVIV